MARKVVERNAKVPTCRVNERAIGRGEHGETCRGQKSMKKRGHRVAWTVEILSRVPVQREAANSYGLPPRMARSKLGGRFRTEGILVREADGAWVKSFHPGKGSMASFLAGWR